MAIFIICAVLMLFFAACLTLCEVTERASGGVRLGLRAGAGIAFIVMGIMMLSLTKGGGEAPVFIGVCFSFLGDIVLAVYLNRRRSEKRTAALGLFLHSVSLIFYFIFFIKSMGFMWLSLPIALFIWLVCAAVISFSRANTEGARLLLYIYAAALSLALSFALFGAINTQNVCAVIGMASLAISACALFTKYFSRYPSPLAALIGLPAAYAGRLMILIAALALAV